MKKFRWITLFMLVLSMVLLLGACTTEDETPVANDVPLETAISNTAPNEVPTENPAEIIELNLATTTSTYDSGLLDVILPEFEKTCGCKVNVIAVGSGQAIQLGVDGNADVLLVHSPAAEEKFMSEEHGVRRESVMYNDMVIVGPEDDPAKIAGMTSAADAFELIAASESTFISRGDDSGTHVKEKSIWAAAEIDPVEDWHISAGQGMGETLTMADELAAYTLSDRATYLSRVKEGLNLKILVEGDPILFNPYHVIEVNPAKSPNIKADLATQFIDWLISVPTQEMIGQFGVADWGDSLFTPDSEPWKNK